MNKAKIIIILVLVFAAVLSLPFLINIINKVRYDNMVKSLPTPTTLNDIAYDIEKRYGFTVYIPENGENVPYFVLTNNYNDDGNCLLLRKYLLDEMMVFRDINYYSYNATKHQPSYYEYSDIDNYLDSEFLEALSSIADKIISSQIIITDNESIGITGKKNLVIKRKIFLLSLTEVRGYDTPTNANEGIPLECYKTDYDNSFIQIDTPTRRTRMAEVDALRIATTSSGEANSWWLRTPETWDASMVHGVHPNGGIGGLDVFGGKRAESGSYEFGSMEYGVRPAFCLPSDTAIYEEEVDGEKRYILKLE